jgi:hypothetical protein
MLDHQERSAAALGQGAVKSSDIERVRKDVDNPDARAAHDDQASAAHRERRLLRRVAIREQAPKR